MDMIAPAERREALSALPANVIHFPNQPRNGANLVVIDESSTGAAAATGNAPREVDETSERQAKESSTIAELERALRLADAVLGPRRTDLCINLVRSAARECPSTNAGQ